MAGFKTGMQLTRFEEIILYRVTWSRDVSLLKTLDGTNQFH